jgi:hypothetical protein
VRDERVDLVERAWIEQQRDSLARCQLAGLVLAAETLLSTAELGATQQISELLRSRHQRQSSIVNLQSSIYLATACDFSQSFRNFSSPMSVSGCLNS